MRAEQLTLSPSRQHCGPLGSTKPSLIWKVPEDISKFSPELFVIIPLNAYTGFVKLAH